MNPPAETCATELGTLIVQTPGVLGGAARINGHRIAVHRVAGWWKQGLSVEEIGARLPALTPAGIHAALAYYHLHREQIESRLEEERQAGRELERPYSVPASV